MDSSPYIGWTPLPHDPGCGQAEWLVHERGRDVLDGSRLDLRFVCPSCGAAHLLRVDTDTRPDTRWGLQVREATTTRRIGYGCPPRRAAGLWLWPAPAPDGSDDPANYVVTTVKARPQRREDVVGAAARYRTARGAHRWLAAVGYDPAVENREGFRSAGAAAGLLADRLPPEPRTEWAESADPPVRSGVDR